MNMIGYEFKPSENEYLFLYLSINHNYYKCVMPQHIAFTILPENIYIYDI